MSSGPARVITVTSGKGGVGKTHTSVNLGLALVRKGKRVLLLDADLGLANINIMLGFEPGATLRDILSGRSSIQDVIVRHDLGFDVLPAASGFPELTSLDNDDRMALLSQMEGLGENYDYVLVDTAAGIGPNVLYFSQAAEDILVVIDPEPTTLTDAYALIKVLSSQYGVKDFLVVANRTPRGSDGRSTFAQLAAPTSKFLNVKLRFLGPIAEDSAVSEAVRSQKPFLELFPSSKPSLDIEKLAERIIQGEGERKPQGGMQFFFKSLVEAGK